MHIPFRLLQATTDFGDSAVLTFATVSATAMLYFGGNRYTALRLAAAVGYAIASIGFLKILFIGCENSLGTFLAVYSPSGHTALSTAFWGSVASYAARGRSRKRTRWIVWIATAVLVAAIAFSRVLLGYHTLSEIIVGFAVGSLALLAARATTPQPEAQTRADLRTNLLVLCGIAIVMLLAHGRHFPAEHIVRALAVRLHTYVPACQAVVR